jgi:hypothetical protein
MQCGGMKKATKMKKGGVKKMAVGGSATNKLNNARGFAPEQKGGDNTSKMIYGIPNAGMTGPNRNSQTETMQKGGVKKPTKKYIDSKIKPMGPDRPAPKPMMAKTGGSKFPDLTGDGKVTQADILKGRGVIKKKGGTMKAKFGASVSVQRSPKAGKVRSASAQGYSAVGKREPGRIIKKTISKKK